MNFIMSHIYNYKEDNHYANNMINIGLDIHSNIRWNEVPVDIKDCYNKNREVITTV